MTEISSLIVHPSELQSNTPISCMIYGQPGCGKTSFAISSSKPILIDLDRGLHRVAKRNQCPSVQVDNYNQVLDIIASSEIEAFETIVIDTFGKLIDRIGDYVCSQNTRLRQTDGSLSQKGWCAVKIASQNLIKLLFAKNKNVIFVSHEREEKDGEERILRPDISGSAGKELIKDLDLMGYMQMTAGNKRVIRFSPTEKFYAKNSLGLPNTIEIPDNTQCNDTFVQLIENRITESRETENKTRNDYELLLQEQNELLSQIKDIESLNVSYKKLKSLRTIWDSTYIWKNAIKKDMQNLTATFNKNLGEFVYENVNAKSL